MIIIFAQFLPFTIRFDSAEEFFKAIEWAQGR